MVLLLIDLQWKNMKSALGLCRRLFNSPADYCFTKQSRPHVLCKENSPHCIPQPCPYICLTFAAELAHFIKQYGAIKLREQSQEAPSLRYI